MIEGKTILDPAQIGAKSPVGFFSLHGVGDDIGICDSGIFDIAFPPPVDCARL